MYKHNIFLMTLVEESYATGIGIVLLIASYFVPFFTGFLILEFIVVGFYVVINISEQTGLTTNIMNFFFTLFFILGIGYKLMYYEPYFKHVRNDYNKTYSYSKSDDGYIITIIDDKKEIYSFTTSNLDFILKDTLDINITENTKWYNQMVEKDYALIKTQSVENAKSIENNESKK